ncbi:hypothetical protein MHLP_04230 [Candidatus Mycoplasma haematolamae str. Purdue]|uniref:Uncharacterized protein n=1 Tax=Mycoplasma haematolamae (strain Purdue) TaxID=1212765 RepID=I7CGN8_MYCHA|nr:hypothetical protein [Candidatus Mycoplasma haematolamae]AFO52426.1 hypothetical protein MHLP_04230 [Candidatus Mycoplasma haematolamae str. Purdue]
MIFDRKTILIASSGTGLGTTAIATPIAIVCSKTDDPTRLQPASQVASHQGSLSQEKSLQRLREPKRQLTKEEQVTQGKLNQKLIAEYMDLFFNPPGKAAKGEVLDQSACLILNRYIKKDCLKRKN